MATAEPSTGAAIWCEQQWISQSAQYMNREEPDFGAMLNVWQENAGRCAGTVIYEARLALVYFYLKQPDKARETLKPVLDGGSPYRPSVLLTQLLLDADEVLNQTRPDRARLQQLEARALTHVRQYPEQPEAFAITGAIESLLGHHEQAISLLEKAAVMVQPYQSKAGVYRNLTISYAELGRYEQAYDAAGLAIGTRKSVMSDPYFVYGVAKAEAGLGMFKQAQTALKVIAAKHPGINQDPDFQATVDFVIARLKSSESR